jgi:hypothetical protein
MATPPRPRRAPLSCPLGQRRLGQQQHAGDGDRVLERQPHDLGRIDDAGLDEIGVAPLGGVEPEGAAARAHLLDHDAPIDARVLGDLPRRDLERPAQDEDAGAQVALDLGRLRLDGRSRPEQREASPGPAAGVRPTLMIYSPMYSCQRRYIFPIHC